MLDNLLLDNKLIDAYNQHTMKTHLTKYDYMESIPCARRLAYHGPEYPMRESGPNPVKDFLTKQGQEVGLIAQELFRGKSSISFEKPIAFDYLFTRPDVLDLKNCELIEIKSSTEIKEEHLLDVAFQKLVCDKAQVKIDRVKIGHINKHYVRTGDVDVKELFKIEDVTDQILPMLPKIEKDLQQLITVLSENLLPQKIIGSHCFSSDGCPFKEECWGDALNDSILTLRRDLKGKRFDLYKNGIRAIKDIPDFVSLTKYQELQKEAEIHNCAIVETNAISDFLNELRFPICFLDFETFALAIPPFEGTHPYQQIPFQASIHKLAGKNLKLKHHSFLHLENTDPRIDITKFLIESLGEEGTIVAYHASFEKARIYELIKMAPNYEKELLALIERIWDLEEIFNQGMYIHSGFKGSTSIKKVLPVLCPELNYDNLDINNGQLAFIQYLKMIARETPKEEKLKIQNDLEAYCTQDTYAMYAIYKKILEII